MRSFSIALFLTMIGITEAVTVEERIKGAFMGTLISDALCLGSHYEYDAPNIKRAYGGIISELMGPGESMGGSTHGVGWGRRNYHPGMKKGDQTDYGLYNVLMLEYLSSRSNPAAPVKLSELLPVWERRVTTKWGAWVCTMTKQSLQQYRQGARKISQLGGMSNAMSMRSAATHAVWSDEKSIIKATRKFMFTHRNPDALRGAKFFARVTHRIIHDNLNPRQAIDSVAADSSTFIQNLVTKAITKYEEAINPATPLSKQEFVDDLAMTSMARLWDVGKSEPIKVGKASPTEGTLPGSVYIILKYMDDLEMAMKANAMVGGDNASRGVNIGVVLGAYHGVNAIPTKLKKQLNQWERCEEMLMKLPLLNENTLKQEL